LDRTPEYTVDAIGVGGVARGPGFVELTRCGLPLDAKATSGGPKDKIRPKDGRQGSREGAARATGKHDTDKTPRAPLLARIPQPHEQPKAQLSSPTWVRLICMGNQLDAPNGGLLGVGG
jgi:hypothetical protein